MEALTRIWWSGPLAWATLYVLDYALAVRAARWHDAHREPGVIVTSPPARAEVVRRGRSVWVTALAGAFVLCAVQRAAAAVRLPNAYLFVLGALVLVEVPLVLRRVYVLAQCALIARNAVTGRVEYEPWAAYYLSAVEVLAFGGVLTAAFALTRDWFVAGGVVSCAVTGADDARRSRAERRRAARRSERDTRR